jgi:hypothetical protein
VLTGESNTERIQVRSAGAAGGTPIVYVGSSRGTVASPTATQSGDNLGYYQFGGYNGTTYTRGAWIQGIADGAYSATNIGSHLVFSTTPNASTTTAERMRIDSSGAVLLGKTSSDYTVVGNQLGGEIGSTVSGGNCFFANRKTSTGDLFLWFYNSGLVGSVSTNGSITLYNTTSDYRLKTVVGNISDAGTRLDALQPIEYDWNTGGRTRGFLAHQFAKVYPNSVSGEKDAVDKEGKPVYQGMQASSSEVMADLIAEIQSLRKRVAQLESK